MKTCVKCHKKMYGSKHHNYCDECWKAKKALNWDKKIPENNRGQPIFADRLSGRKA